MEINTESIPNKSLDLNGSLERFMKKDYGLKSFQPTILWQVFIEGVGGNKLPWTREDNGLFFYTNNVVVPGYQITSDHVYADAHSIPYPIYKNNSTKNTLTIGIYVDVFSVTERYLIPWMRKIEATGSMAVNKSNITLYGYMMSPSYMGTSGKRYPSEEYLRLSDKSGNLQSMPVKLTGNWERNVHDAYICYKFRGCYPIDIPSYTYDQQNQKWGNVRNIVFSFCDYDVQLKPDVSIKKILNGYNDPIWKKAYELSNQEKMINIKDNVVLGTNPDSIKDSDFYKDTEERSIKYLGHEGSINQYIQRGPSVDRINSENASSNDELDAYLYHNFDNGEDTINKVYDANAYERTAPNLPLSIKFINQDGDVDSAMTPFTKSQRINYDTPKFKQENKWMSLIKSMAKGYIMPDTPIYNDNKLREGISKVIRKVEQWFYEEPKHKDVPADDHTDIFHSPADVIGINPDDTPNASKDGVGAKIVEIPYDDHAMLHTHSNGDLVHPDEYDFTWQFHHGNPNPISIDPNDHTRIENHIPGDLIGVDPNDHTKLESHIPANLVGVDPNDYVVKSNIGNPLKIDPNDHVQSHGKADLVNIDPNTRLTTHKEVPDLVPSQNDTVDSATLHVDGVNTERNSTVSDKISDFGPHVDADPNDHVDAMSIKPNMVEVNPNDIPSRAVENTFDTSSNNVIPANDTVDSTSIKVDTIKIGEDTPVLSRKLENEVVPSSNDKISNGRHEKVDEIIPHKNDGVTHGDGKFSYKNVNVDHKDTPDIKIDGNDLVNSDRRGYENIGMESKIKNIVKSEKSIIDFAKTINGDSILKIERSSVNVQSIDVNNVKTGNQENAMTSHGKVNLVVPDGLKPDAEKSEFWKFVNVHFNDQR